MTFTLRLGSSTHAYSYATALQVWHNAYPVKGSTTRRYLARKYDNTKIIIHDQASETQEVAFRYHDTDCVVWQKDNVVKIDTGGYGGSPCTRAFIKALSNYRIYTHKGNQVMQVSNKLYAFGDTLVIDSLRESVLAGAIPAVKKVLNRARAKELMQHWKPVFTHLKALCAMNGGVLAQGTMGMRWSKYVNAWKVNNETLQACGTVHNWITANIDAGIAYKSARAQIKKALYDNENAYDHIEIPLGEIWQ